LNLDHHDPRMTGPLLFLGFCKQQTAFMCGYDCVAVEKSKISDQYLRTRAQRNLERADVVVIMEKLDDMLDQLRYHTDWIKPTKKKFRKENRMSVEKKSHLSLEAVSIISKWSYLDIEIYESAKIRHRRLTSFAKKCLTKS